MPVPAGFRVKGIIDGTPYEVLVTADGQVHGSGLVRALVGQHHGTSIRIPGGGPLVTVDVGDPAGVFGCLLAHTRVLETVGQLPDLVG